MVGFATFLYKGGAGPKRTAETYPGAGAGLSGAPRAEIVRWAEKRSDKPTLSEAIRRLVELGLTVKTRSAPSERQRAAFANLASKAIDSLTVGTPDTGERASRKRRLLKGPEEFREDRVDLPKAKGK